MDEITYTGFSGRAARETIGESAAVAFDPENREFYVFTRIGSGTPEVVWHNRHVSFSIPANASLEAVEETLREMEETTEALLECYEGVEWDGHNNVGSWEDGYEEHLEALEAAIKGGDSEEGVATYWKAEDWLGGDPGAVMGEIEALMRDGKTVEEAVEERVTIEVEAAADEDALIDESDTRKVLTGYAERIAKKIADEEDA
jgi:hypothetical protein